MPERGEAAPAPTFFYAKRHEIDSFAENLKRICESFENRNLRNNHDFLEELDAELARQYEIFGSRTKLSAVLKHRGICLTTGKQHGADLPRVLKRSRNLRIRLKIVKDDYEYVKHCLVNVRGA